MKVSVDGEAPAVDAKAFVSNGEVYVVRSGRQTRVRLQDFSAAVAQSGGGDGTVRAPMHGKLLGLFVRAGDAVEAGQRLAVIEAMKMEHTLRAPIAGIVTEVVVGEGTQVVEAAKILVIAPDKPG
jgi:3-methylcrotonyl-CoA carboxylase alpha subunit